MGSKVTLVGLVISSGMAGIMGGLALIMALCVPVMYHTRTLTGQKKQDAQGKLAMLAAVGCLPILLGLGCLVGGLVLVLRGKP